MIKIISLVFIMVFIFIGCEDKDTNHKHKTIQNTQKELVDPIKRWYTIEMVKKGEPIYQNNCASCHGKKAQGMILPWNKKMANGKYPPPPLNDDAHAWHHPLYQLREIINKGGALYKGDMPPFEDKLSDEEIENVIAYFQDFWTQPFYEEWAKRQNQSRQYK